MPRGNGTGPMGRGPMTGRGLGFCAGLALPALMGLAFGRGREGRGGGRGWRNMFHATGLTGWQRAAMAGTAPSAATVAPTAETEKQFLETQVEAIQSHLDEVKRRLAELETAKTQE
jgi:hypothetical protein